MTISTPGSAASTTKVKELSGPSWAGKFKGSSDTRDLIGSFRLAVEEFITAMNEAGMRVTINATYRPVKRSYLMHWSWRIGKGVVKAEDVPAMEGVDIEWVHEIADDSIKAARELMSALGIANLGTSPALRSQHNAGLAIDMSITWSGTVSIKDAAGKIVTIRSLPRTGMNRDLIKVGHSYGVRKYNGGGRDVPHWSNNGR